MTDNSRNGGLKPRRLPAWEAQVMTNEAREEDETLKRFLDYCYVQIAQSATDGLSSCLIRLDTAVWWDTLMKLDRCYNGDFLGDFLTKIAEQLRNDGYRVTRSSRTVSSKADSPRDVVESNLWWMTISWRYDGGEAA